MKPTSTYALALAITLPVFSGCDPPRAAGDDDDDDSTAEACAYPEGAVDPMELDQVLTPYSWATGIHGDGTTAAIDLGTMPCATDEVIDWSPFDVLLFVSIPAW